MAVVVMMVVVVVCEDGGGGGVCLEGAESHLHGLFHPIHLPFRGAVSVVNS